MSTPRRFVKNVAALSVAEFASRVLGSVLSIVVARLLGADIFGQFAFATSFISFFNIFADFGLTTLGIREIAKDRAKTNTLGTNILMMQVILALSLIVVLTAVLFFIPLDDRTKLIVWLFGIAILPQALNMSYIFQAHEQMEFVALSRIIYQVGYTLAGFLIVFLTMDIIGLPIANVVAAFVSSVMVLILLRQHLYFRLERSDSDTKRHLVKQSLPFVISAVSVQIYINLD
jgi:O-antigen/teichoic acid export membrane protein